VTFDMSNLATIQIDGVPTSLTFKLDTKAIR